MDIKELHKQSMSDPKYRAAYDALEDEFTLASELIRARTRAGLTQADVAERMGTKQSAISRIEAGRNVSVEKLRGYAEAVGGQLKIQIG